MYCHKEIDKRVRPVSRCGPVLTKQTSKFVGGQNEEPATFEEYALVMGGKANPEQIARVRAALADMDSQLRQDIGAAAPLARWMLFRRHGTAEEKQRFIEAATPAAKRNFDRLFNYLLHKRDIGAISQEVLETVCAAVSLPEFDKQTLTPSEWAMCMSRMSRAIIELHPELEAEVRALPISRRR